MTEATTLYIIRHGKTMFNTIGRTQGWSDTPLTKQGEEGIYHLGLGLRDIDFKEAYSSDSGRAMQTAQIILQEHQNHQKIPYLTDKRIREWCFGSLDGGYDGELWGVVPRILAFKSYEDMMTTKITYRELANAIIEADTADWAELMKLSVIVFGLVSKISLIIEKKMVAAKYGGFPWTNNFLFTFLN